MMDKMKLKILKMIKNQPSQKPKEIIDYIGSKNQKNVATAESALRSMVSQGVLILNKNRKIVMPKNKVKF